MRKIVSSTFALALGLSLCTMSVVICMPDIVVNANSAQSYWQGISSTGAIVTDENCPLEVQQEKLVFDLQEFPNNYYNSREEFLEYSAKVTAEYTFYNPADYTVKATLAFPFGRLSDYGMIYDPETGGYDYSADAEKYDITVNGEPVEKEIRYTLSDYYDSFDILESLQKLGGEYVDDDFYSPSMTVTKYFYEPTGIDQGYHAAYASFLHNCDPSKTRIWLNPNSGASRRDEQIALGEWAENEKTIILYVFGEPLTYEPSWTVYENAGETTVIDGTVERVLTKTMTFEEFVFSEYFGEYSSKSGISHVDWYNAVVCSLNECLSEDFGYIRYAPLDIGSQFMRWYQYEIELAPKSTLVNTVTAPMYPSIDTDYEPPVYGYTYLLSPAKTWNKFGALDIEICTPYYLIDDENGFMKTENGYALSLDGLPEGELEFTLSSEEDPKDTRPARNCAYGLAYAFLIPYSCILSIGDTVGCGSAIVSTLGVYGPLALTAVVLFFKKRK